MIGTKRTLLSVLISLLLVGTAVVSTWLMASAGVFTGGEQALPSAPESTATTAVSAVGRSESLAVTSDFRVSQPRDPFEPLVPSNGGDDTTTTTTTGDGDTTTTTAGDGDTTTTTSGSTTTTTAGDDPDGIRVTLLEVRTESGARVAVVEVDGETYTVGVGDRFATSFKVVSLSDNGGVFTYGDSAFTLSVGQSITK